MTFAEEHFTDGYVYAPRLIDIIHDRDDPVIGTLCSSVGFDKLVIPSTATYVTARFSELTTRFNERYMFRRINQESLQRWQVRLQNRMDEIVGEMDRAYRLYATTTDIDAVVKGSKITYNHTNTHGGSDGSSGSTQDVLSTTPDSSINLQNNYASNVTKGTSSSTNTYNSTNALSGNDTTTIMGPEVLLGVNVSIKSYMDIDTFFIEQFENNFLNIFD